MSKPTAITDPPDADLPTDIDKVYDADCMHKKLLQLILNALQQTKSAGPPGPTQPDPIAALEGETTPFGLPAVAFTGPGMAPAAGSQPLGLPQGAEYLTPAQIPTINAGDLYAPVGSDCSVPTTAPNFMFPIYKAVNYPTVDQASTHRHLSGWTEFMGGRDAPRPYAPGVTAFYAAHAHKANPEVDPGFSFNLLKPRPPTPPPFRDAISNSALLLSQISTATQPPYVVVETGHALWGILDQLNWSDHVTPLAAPWVHDSGGQRTLGIYHLASYIDSQTYDYAHDTWTQSYTEYGGQGDYAEVTAPVAWFSGDGENVDQARVSVHVTGDKWHPANDQWLDNGKNTKCPTLGDQLPWFPMNPNYGDVDGFCPDQAAVDSIPQLQDYTKRTDFCSLANYDPGIAGKHWKLLKDRTAFAGLWGQLPRQGSPTAKFPSSDLVHAGAARTNNLHQGSDINWVFDSGDIETTDLLGDFGSKVCWSQVAGEDQIAMSCNDPDFNYCQGAGCCDPIDRFAQEFNDNVGAACSCDSAPHCGDFQWFCDGANAVYCVGKDAIICGPVALTSEVIFWVKTVLSYASDVCVPFTGKPDCGTAGLTVCSADPSAEGDSEMENELEYNLAYGAEVNKTGREAQYTYPGQCSQNTELGPIGPTICEEGQSYIPGNWLFPSGYNLPHIFQDFPSIASTIATVSLDHDMNLAGTFNAGKALDTLAMLDRTAPLTLGPGIFQKPYGAWAYMATTSGQRSGAPPRILVPPPDIHAAGLKILNEAKPQPYAFRMEMLGDLIVDCGHVPFRSEIHPPVAIELHLAGATRARYSLWGWHRSSSSTDRGPVDVELWPDLPRPSATAQLKLNVVFDGGIGSGEGKWDCAPSPPDVPTHFECTLPASPPKAQGNCNDNPRMRPDCASDVAGGLVEVYWQ